MKKSFKTSRVVIKTVLFKELFEKQTFIQKLFRIKPKMNGYKVDEIEMFITAKGFTKVVNNLMISDILVDNDLEIKYVLVSKEKNKMALRLLNPYVFNNEESFLNYNKKLSNNEIDFYLLYKSF